jgi:hypothetical protein
MIDVTDTEVNIPERTGQTYDYVLHGAIVLSVPPPPGYGHPERSDEDDEYDAQRARGRSVPTRVRVHRDDIAPQSYALVEVFDREAFRWNEVVSPLPTTVAAATPSPYTHDRGQIEDDAFAYAEALFRQADALLNGSDT